MLVRMGTKLKVVRNGQFVVGMSCWTVETIISVELPVRASFEKCCGRKLVTIGSVSMSDIS